MKIENFWDIGAWQEARRLTKFLNVAIGSNTEVQSHLFVALDLGYIDKVQFDECFEQSKRVEKATNGFITYLKKRPT